jgi:predicted MFS family arabinose efflux permease
MLPWDELRELPRPAWILFGGTFINRFGSFVLAFLVFYLTSRGFSAATAGVALSAYGLGSMAASLASGHLADTIGRRNSITVSMFSSAATMLALSQARDIAAISTVPCCTALSCR